MAKTIYWIQYTQKKVEAGRKSENDRKELYKLINKAVYSQTTKNLRNWINLKL